MYLDILPICKHHTRLHINTATISNAHVDLTVISQTLNPKLLLLKNPQHKKSSL